MEDKMRLPVTRNPLITSWQWHATLFSILSEDDNAKKWIYSNYIQLRSFKVEEIFTGDEILFADMIPGTSSLKACPYLVTSLMTKSQIECYCGDIVDFIIKTLDLGGYVYGVFDEAKILSDYSVDYKFPHELFIYGYNRDKKYFYTGDFTFKERYSHNTVSFEELRKGYDAISPDEDHMFRDDYMGHRGLYVIFKNTENPVYEVDIEFIKESIFEYLNSVNTKKKYRMLRNVHDNTTYGISVLDAVYDRLMEQVNMEEPDFDIRAIHVLYDHKKLMYERIKYLMERGYIAYDAELLDNYSLVVKNMLTARNLLIKISITENMEDASRFKMYFGIAREKEASVLLEVLSRLEKRK